MNTRIVILPAVVALTTATFTACDVRYEVVTPRSVAVTAHGTNANVAAAGFERPLAISTENGDITLG